MNAPNRIKLIDDESKFSPSRTTKVKKLPLANRHEISEIVCISSFPPRECGIATFSADLEKALKEKYTDTVQFTTYPLVSDMEAFAYEQETTVTLNVNSAKDFWAILERINNSAKTVLVLIQHEFGLYKKNEDVFLEFLSLLEKPVAMTFHTVLPNPDSTLKKKVEKISEYSEKVIVMTQTSANILVKDYDVPRGKIEVIPHGTHLVSYEDKNLLKEKYGLKGKKVLSTFGLLGPGKNIETTLRALPGIVEENPTVVFLIIGKTHPTLVREFGEDYRLYLQNLISELGLEKNVEFVNRFLPTTELLEYLQLTDIYLFTSKDPNQAVSGTFAYALSCGCPVVSTPIPHALEVLRNNAGRVFDFSDHRQLEKIVIELLANPEELERMRLNGLHTSANSAWQNVAIAHTDLFERICGEKIRTKFRIPAINLDHLYRMTTDIGIVQFCKINRPDLKWGYTLDDNARALLVMCRHYKLTANSEDLDYIKLYFKFIASCFRTNGKFMNYVDENCRFTRHNQEENLEDANGRAIWALGNLLSISLHFPKQYECINEKAEFLFFDALAYVSELRSPRAIAFSIKGLCFYALENGVGKVESLLKKLADRLVEHYNDTNAKDWEWYESYLTYGNAVLPHALLLSSIVLGKPKYANIARKTFDFLLDKIIYKDTIRVISNKKWFTKGDAFSKDFKGGQQPIDVAYTILALDLFHSEFPDGGYNTLKENAFSWFLGNNPMHQTIYNPCTGGCYDGIELNNVNLNQGAESTLSYLLARLTFKESFL